MSTPVAEAMAQGALERSPADLVIAITGVAGPEPDEDGNPVGLVYVAAAKRGCKCRVKEQRFGKLSKTTICQFAMLAAITLADLLIDREAGACL